MLQAKGTSGTVTFDGRTVTITRKGLIQRSVSQGLHGTATYPVGQITGVRIQLPGAHAGQFTLLAAGTRDEGVRRASGGGDPMTVLFQRRAQRDFEALRDAINEAINRPAAPAFSQQPAAGPSIAEELDRVSRLYAQGNLTFEQFEAAKAQILGQGQQQYAAPGPQDQRPW